MGTRRQTPTVQPIRFRTTPAAPLAENAAALDPCFLRHLLPTDLGSGLEVAEQQGVGCELFSVRYGCPSVRAWGLMPARQVMLALVAEADAPVMLNGVECPRHSLVLIGEGSPLFIRADGAVTFLACRMDRAMLPVPWQVVLSASPEEPANFLAARLSAEAGLRLAEALGRLMGAGGAEAFARPAAADHPNGGIRPLLNDLPTPSMLRVRTRRAPLARRHAALASFLREQENSQSVARWTVPDLMQRLDVRRRTLEYDIHELAGMSPHAWLTALRLDRVRVDLMEPEADKSVGEVAGRWGFFHQGRFARAYRTRFGELPRITAARAARRDTASAQG